jgi:general secretion pathway protein C
MAVGAHRSSGPLLANLRRMGLIAVRGFRTIEFAATAMCAVLLARAATHAVELGLIRGSGSGAPALPEAPGAPVAAREVATDRRELARLIVERNIFCSTCPPMVDSSTADLGASLAPQPTTLPLDLLAITHLISQPRPAGSMAVLRDRTSRSIGAFSPGDRVKGALIARIEETRVYLLHASQEEFLDLLDSPADQKPPPPALAAPTRQPAAPISPEGDRGIRKTGDRSYEIQRSTLEGFLGNMNLLAGSARILPEVRNGRPAGFRLLSVLPQGPFARLGLQPGDIIVSINGLELTSPEKAFEVYGKLRSAASLSLGLERTGKRTTLEYAIR